MSHVTCHGLVDYQKPSDRSSSSSSLSDAANAASSCASLGRDGAGRRVSFRPCHSHSIIPPSSYRNVLASYNPPIIPHIHRNSPSTWSSSSLFPIQSDIDQIHAHPKPTLPSFPSPANPPQPSLNPTPMTSPSSSSPSRHNSSPTPSLAVSLSLHPLTARSSPVG